MRDVETKARWSRFADRADEVHLMRVATNAIGEFRKHGTLAGVFGHLPV